MIKFKNGQLEIKMLDSTIVVISKARNVFTLLNSSDVDTLEEIEKQLKECKMSFKFKMSFNSRKDILKVMVNDVIYSLNAILI
jgi:hypothetical protein